LNLCLLLRYYLNIRNSFHWWSLTAFATKIIHTVMQFCPTLGSVLAITRVLNNISCKNCLYSGAAVCNIVLHTVCCCVWIWFNALSNSMLFCMQLYLLECCIYCHTISGYEHLSLVLVWTGWQCCFLAKHELVIWLVRVVLRTGYLYSEPF
jgi:hypothetical protein